MTLGATQKKVAPNLVFCKNRTIFVLGAHPSYMHMPHSNEKHPRGSTCQTMAHMDQFARTILVVKHQCMELCRATYRHKHMHMKGNDGGLRGGRMIECDCKEMDFGRMMRAKVYTKLGMVYKIVSHT